MSFFSWSARRRVVCVAVSVVRRPPRLFAPERRIIMPSGGLDPVPGGLPLSSYHVCARGHHWQKLPACPVCGAAPRKSAESTAFEQADPEPCPLTQSLRLFPPYRS